MKHLPAWTGWPGTGPAPGHDWFPRPFLRSVILFLAYAFLALSLTVNYAASITFFLLAIIGMYVGFRRGFVNGLTKTEKVAMIIFAAYPTVAIISYVFGAQTNVGFRFLGRDLRFLLFIPIYLGIRWSRPRPHHIGWALACGVLGASIMAMIQHQPWPAPTPHGVTGTHITFGDLSILSGFLSSALLWPWATKRGGGHMSTWNRRVGAGLGLLTGILTGILASARGGWLAIPVLLLIFLWLPPVGTRFTRTQRLLLSVNSIALLVVTAWVIPGIHHRIRLAERNLNTYITVANTRTINARCVDRKTFLHRLLSYSHILGPGRVNVVRLSQTDRRQAASFGCEGSYALWITHNKGDQRPLHVSLYRGNDPFAPAHSQTAAVLVKSRGKASLNIGWTKPWVVIRPTRDWQAYRVTHIEKGIQWINLFIKHGSLWLIPRQVPHGFFAYALAKTSIGHRLEMWRAAWALFLKHPFLGSGTGSFYPLGEKALGASAMTPVVGDFQHAHSDYFTSLGTQGIIGLLAVIFVLVSPLLALRRRQDRHCPLAGPLTGSMLTGGMATFALTETIFVHSFVLSWFTVVVAILLAATLGAKCLD